ncbi:hypothetical protein GO984_21875 [Rhodobacteraceae bacterium CY05]|uniref:Uncharacterized protein n=1 Tax=Parasedimentitalea huanghaiensis TaxID=2682100 RepID=A0A6L6WKW6_9RHOB|nr:hypothetical protein [Zongyanglinia huanghaiensis]
MFWIALGSPVTSQYESPVTEKSTSGAIAANSNTGVFDLQSPGIYSETLERANLRPLFSETRREPAAISAPKEEPIIADVEPQETDIEEPPAMPLPPQLEYRGFMKSSSSIRALLSDIQTGEENWVSKGDVISQWRVAKVSNIQVHLQLEDFVHIVEINR